VRPGIILFLTTLITSTAAAQAPFLPFGSVTITSLRSSIPIGDILRQTPLTDERKVELNTEFREISDSIFHNPSDGLYYYQRALIRKELGAMRGALDDLMMAKQKGYRKRQEYLELGIVNGALGERPAALGFLDVCLRKDSTDSEVHFYKGVVLLYLKSGVVEERCHAAIDELNLALRRRDAWILRGCAYDRLGEHDLATDDFKKALEMSPGEPTIMLLLGQAKLGGRTRD